MSKPIYHQPPSLLERLWQWLVDLVNRSGGGALPPWQALAIGLAVLAIVIFIVWRLAGPLRRRVAARQPRAVLAGEERSASELRTAAQERAASGDWRQACVLIFQVIARRFEERDILDRNPGRTAHELAHDAARLLPSLADGLRWAAQQFDAVAYGDHHADERTYRALLELADRADETKPNAAERTGAAQFAEAGRVSGMAVKT